MLSFKLVFGQIFICPVGRVATIQVRGFAPIGMVECWNIGKMVLGYCNIG
jgi:hypothetical protein